MKDKLFKEFSGVSLKDWETKATADLKGKSPYDFATKTEDGISINPYYNSENSAPATVIPTRKNRHWQIIEEFLVTDEKRSNLEILERLNEGVNGIILYVEESVDMDILLNQILVEHITVHWVSENPEAISEKWVNFIEKNNYNIQKTSGSINSDVFENLLRTGNWFSSRESDLARIKSTLDKNLGNTSPLAINANIYHNSGATTAQELALTLTHIHEYYVLFGAKALKNLWVNLAIGSEYFVEIAKFRAFRLLFENLLTHLGETGNITLYTESGLTNKTIYDPWVNMLRTTTEGMSAVIGGADEICLKSYDIRFAEPEGFGLRIARNQQLLMMGESYLSSNEDPGKGAFFIEELTQKLGEEAWKIFVDLEAKGGWMACANNNTIQGLVGKSAAAKLEKFESGEITLLGTNLYPNQKEKMKGEIQFSPSNHKDLQSGEINPLRPLFLALNMEIERLEKEEAND